PRDDLLSMLMEGGSHSAENVQRLRDDVVTFLVAGHDTVSLGLTWTWLLLAEHPDAGDRLAREIGARLGSRVAGVGDVPRLSYTRAVLREALRLYPPAWVIVRRTMVPVRLGDVGIPPGSLVVASPYVMHRDARYFTFPEEFNPSRWLAPDEDAAQ